MSKWFMVLKNNKIVYTGHSLSDKLNIDLKEEEEIVKFTNYDKFIKEVKKIERAKQHPTVEQRVDKLEMATGTVGTGERGIAHRLDKLEERLDNLESKT